MVASKRVPAAYRKHNRVSHLTADAVHRLGFRLDDSGKKLTVGQMRNQRQRGGTGDDPQAPEPPTLSHWATSIVKKRREAYLQQYHQSFIDTGIDDARGQPTTDTRLVFERVIGATPNTAARSVAPAATPDHVQAARLHRRGALRCARRSPGRRPRRSPASLADRLPLAEPRGSVPAWWPSLRRLLTRP
jgi:hypothetical protein